MKRIIFSIFASCAMATSIFAQGKFSFSEENKDFGMVVEGEQATHIFKFTNIGNAPIIISGVSASCGCTTPTWTKDPVMPGAVGEIKAVYNSQGRPGMFNKSIRVTSNADEATKTLYIKGEVVKEAPKVYTEEEKKMSPRLFVEKTEYNFGKVQQGENISKTITIRNDGKQNLEIKEVKSSCFCVNIIKNTPPIAPGKTGIITVSYAPKGVGEKNERITLVSNDIIQKEFNLTFKSQVVEESKGVLNKSANPF